MYRIGIKNAIFTLCKGWHFLCNIIYVTFHNIFYNQDEIQASMN